MNGGNDKSTADSAKRADRRTIAIIVFDGCEALDAARQAVRAPQTSPTQPPRAALHVRVTAESDN
jgi:hypothetical protein